MKTFKISVIAFTSVVLAGCQTTSDPTQGGFLGGLHGLSSGAYDQRIKDRQHSLEDGQDRNVALVRENERLSQRQEATRAQLTQMEQEYEALSQDLAALRSRLAGAKGDTQNLERQMAQLQQQVNLAKSDTFSDDATRQKTLEELQRKKNLLQDEIDLLVGG